jgi:Flp pilus assembly protein CpaB
MKNKLPLVIAIIVGLAAIVAIRSYVKRIEELNDAKLRGPTVVAARMDIPAGVELKMEMVYPLSMPEKFIPSQAIRGSDQLKQVLGRKTLYAVKAEKPILWSDLAREALGGLSTIIPAGKGAFTVSISRGIKSGLIQPGDHLDILGSFGIPKPTQPLPTGTATWRQGSDMVNLVLLQNVAVLAVGETMGGSARSDNTSAGDLTLALTLLEAQTLMFAAQHGELGAVLRGTGATEFMPREQLPRVTFEAIEKIIGDLDEKRHVREVEVQKGGKSSTVPVMKSTSEKGE